MFKKEDFESISLNDAAKLDGKPVKEIFCEHWPEAQAGLHLLQLVIKNKVLQGILGFFIWVGNNIEKKYCSNETVR